MKNDRSVLGKINLLPNYFKKIGLVLLFVAYPLFLLMLAFHNELGIAEKGYNEKNIFYNFLIFSCLLMIMSKDKVEDELASQIRFKAGFFGLVVGVGCFLLGSINPFGLYDDSVFQNMQGLIFFMLVSSLLMKYFMIRKSKKEELD